MSLDLRDVCETCGGTVPTGEPPCCATRQEWINAVSGEKANMYMSIACTSVTGPHEAIKKLLESDERLAQSEHGKRYLAKTADIDNLLLARDHLDSAIENLLADALGAASLKHWGGET